MEAASTAAIQRKLIELNDRYRTLQKALEVEETTYATIADGGLEKNKQYAYSQAELSKIEDRRSLALNELEVKFNTFKGKKEAEIATIKNELEVHIEAYKAKKEAEISKIRSEMEAHIEAYSAKKGAEIKGIEQEIEAKEAAFDEKKALKEKSYDTQVRQHQETCMKIAEKAGIPNAIGYHRKKTDYEMVQKQISELERELVAANEREVKKMKEEHDRRLAEEIRKADAQKALDYSNFLAAKAAEREADERKAAAREERKKKLRDALRRCKTEEDVWDVENDQDYMDWEDEELIANYKEKMKSKPASVASTSESNSIVEATNPLGNQVYHHSAPLATTQETPGPLGTAKLLQSTKPKMMGKQLMPR